MSPSTILSSILIIVFFVSNVIIVVHSTPLIDQACSHELILRPEKPQCLRLLQSQPKIASATTPLNIFVAITQLGASRTTATLKHVERLLENSTPSDYMAALQECQLSFKWSASCFDRALTKVRDNKDYKTSTIDLLTAATDAIQFCRRNILSNRINDRVIANGLREARLYGLSGYKVVTMFWRGGISGMI